MQYMNIWIYPKLPQGMVTVLVAIDSVTDEAPAHGCGGSLVTNDVSGDAST